MVVFGGDNTGDAKGGDGGIEKGRLDSDGKIRVDSLGGRDARARVDVDDFSDGVRMDEIAGDYEVIRMPLQIDALSAAGLFRTCRDSFSRNEPAGQVMQRTMSSGSSGRSETCSSSNSLGICRDTSFMVNLGSKMGYGSISLIRKQIRCDAMLCFGSEQPLLRQRFLSPGTLR